MTPPTITAAMLALVCACDGNAGGSDEHAVAHPLEAPAAQCAPTASNPNAPSTPAPSSPQSSPSPESPPASRGASGLTSSDPRVLWWIDPRVPFGQLLPGVSDGGIHAGQTSGYIDIRSLDDHFALNGIELVTRGADPLDATKAAYHLRTEPAAPLTGGQWHKTEILSYGEGPNVIRRGVDTWIAYAVRLNGDMFGANNPGMSILDLHKADSAQNEGDERGNSPFSIYVGGDGGFDVSIRGMKPGSDLSTWFTPASAIDSHDFPVAPAASDWVKFVFEMNIHYDASQGPYTLGWYAVGDGPLVKFVDYRGSNGFNDESPYTYQKFGLYMWDPWSGSASRSIDSKGLYVFEERPGTAPLDALTLRRLLDEI